MGASNSITTISTGWSSTASNSTGRVELARTRPPPPMAAPRTCRAEWRCHFPGRSSPAVRDRSPPRRWSRQSCPVIFAAQLGKPVSAPRSLDLQLQRKQSPSLLREDVSQFHQEVPITEAERTQALPDALVRLEGGIDPANIAVGAAVDHIQATMSSMPEYDHFRLGQDQAASPLRPQTSASGSTWPRRPPAANSPRAAPRPRRALAST
jgi:hypothetical protein